MEWNEMSQSLFNNEETRIQNLAAPPGRNKVFDNNSSFSWILFRGPFDNSTSMLWTQIKRENSKIDLRW